MQNLYNICEPPPPLQENKMSSFHQRLFKININTCAYQDLRALPGAGQVLADRIWDLRKHGHISLEDLATIPKLRITPDLLDCP